jgi:fatty acid desaturase
MTLNSEFVATPQHEPSGRSEALGEGLPQWVRQAREMVSDLHQRSAAIYWTDFLLSIAAAWALAALCFMTPGWPAIKFVALLGAAIFFFRAGTFIHEIIHFRPRELVWFARAWNLLMGIPLLMPWIIYRNHVDHHSVRYFGTPDDGEYLPLAAAPVKETIKYVLQAPVLPLFTVFRFGIVGPLSWLHRGLREWVLTAASAGVSNPYYRKRFPAADEKHLLIVEVLCFAWLALVTVLVVKGVITGPQLFTAYVLLTLTLSLNWVRNLAAHRYGNLGERMTHSEQFEDSINITGQTWLTMLMFPVGLRYHALHHLFPTLPYHNLGKAHRRLSEQLPANAPYHATSRNSYFTAVSDLWRKAGRVAHADSAIARWRQHNRRA